MSTDHYKNSFENEWEILQKNIISYEERAFFGGIKNGVSTAQAKNFLDGLCRYPQNYADQLLSVALNRALFYDHLDAAQIFAGQNILRYKVLERLTLFDYPPKKCVDYFLGVAAFYHFRDRGTQTPLRNIFNTFSPEKIYLAEQIAEMYFRNGKTDQLIDQFFKDISNGRPSEKAFDWMLSHIWKRISTLDRQDILENAVPLASEGMPLILEKDREFRAETSKKHLETHLTKEKMSEHPKKNKL